MFDTVGFLRQHFQDVDALLATLSSFGLPAPNRETARKWFTRASIPSEWFPVLVCAAEIENGGPIRLAVYLELGVK